MRRATDFLAQFFWAILTAAALLTTPAAAQSTADKIILMADSVQFDANAGKLEASGNVEIFFSKGVLRTSNVTFYQAENRIEVAEPLILNSQQEMTLAAASAVFDMDLENGLILGAQGLLQEQFQFAAAEYQRTENRFNIFNESVASTCFICEKNEIPFWQIRARRIVHDEKQKRIYFEGARLDFLGVPILYTPLLRIPDPSVDRATGLLVPRFSTSNTLGYGVELPYFITFGDHADLTLTPNITSKESAVLTAEYRRMFRSGEISLDGAIALADPLSDSRFRSSLEADGTFRLRRDYRLSFGVNLASDDDFRKQYDLGDEDRLSSFIDLTRTTGTSYFAVGTSRTQSLRSEEVDEDIPVVLPEFYYRRRLDDPVFGGNSSYELSSIVLLRESQNQFIRIGGDLSWRRNWQGWNGLIGSIYGSLSGNGYWTHDHLDYGTTQEAEVIPLLATDVSWPLSRHVGAVTHLIEPVAQLVWSPDSIASEINEDSDQVEFEATNLFSYNRFPGFDRLERGVRLNVGLSYTRLNPSGWTFGGTFGRVYRLKDLGQFDATNTAGLRGRRSDFVSLVRVSFPDRFELINRNLFDTNFSIAKNETQVSYASGKWDVAASYVWLEEDVILNQSDTQHEISLDVDYHRNRNWTYSADWRQNLNTGKSIEGELGLRYKNECVTVNFSLSLEFAASGIAEPKREFGVTVALAGIGSRQNKSKLAQRCAL